MNQAESMDGYGDSESSQQKEDEEDIVDAQVETGRNRLMSAHPRQRTPNRPYQPSNDYDRQQPQSYNQYARPQQVPAPVYDEEGDSHLGAVGGAPPRSYTQRIISEEERRVSNQARQLLEM